MNFPTGNIFASAHDVQQKLDVSYHVVLSVHGFQLVYCVLGWPGCVAELFIYFRNGKRLT